MVGRPVKVLWKTNREFPKYFVTQPGRVFDSIKYLKYASKRTITYCQW
jgi:hypothetical protein